ncbi:HNH endonuclease [Lentzea tibetensis]|uniref:HNH endonuclease n=1 Tax=Lentzea tibetensis TaxID=2591470 RepID=UPI001F193CC4|nr:HNH endonuclease [Lentzea tibetensis]
MTRQAILSAIKEYDASGGEQFLDQHGYRRARNYFLVHNGREYDSKAIVGVAHGYLPGRSPLRADEFSGGLATVVPLLHDRGFEIREIGANQNPSWLEAELVLVCEQLVLNNWKPFRAGDSRRDDLSRLLQALPLHPLEDRGRTFRSPDSVKRKMDNIATSHPDYEGTRTRGGKLDMEVLHAFLERPEEMRLEAEAIRRGVESGELVELRPIPDLDEMDAAEEGRILLRRHLARERNPKLRKQKIRSVLRRHGCLECEVCDFDFERVYGERGASYAECHHVTPLHVSGTVRTTLDDLAILCANCHRMIHRGTTWLTPPELRELVVQRRS